MRRYILTTALVLLAVMAGFAQTDALVVELDNGLADIYPVSDSLRIVNQTDRDSIAVVEGAKCIATYASADVKRIAFDEEALLTDSVERAALVALYNAADGDHWKNNTNWCSDKPLSEWYGVTVTEGRVTKLNLYQNQLMGAIPSELGNLTNLTSLDLGNNQLTGEIPESFNKLTALIAVDAKSNRQRFNINLSYNNLSGQVPSIFTDSPAWKDEWCRIMEWNPLYDLSEVYVPAPSFLVKDIEGNDLDSKETYPKNSYTAFFYPNWADAWRNPFKDLDYFYQYYKKLGYEVVGISKKSNISENEARQFMMKYNVTWRFMVSHLNNMFDYHPSLYEEGVSFPNGRAGVSLVDSDGRLVYSSAICGMDALQDFLTNRLGPIRAMVVEQKNGLSDIYPTSATIHAVDLPESNNIDVADCDSIIASYPRADVKRIVYGDEQQLTDSVERAALVALYNATDGAHWRKKTNWNTSEPLSQWYGITFEKGHVTHLLLYRNNLKGTIPVELGNLKYSWDVELQENELTGKIPTELGRLKKIEYLILNDNQLTGTIPSFIGDLPELWNLALGNNQLTGSIPSSLGNLTKLWSLTLFNNQLSGEIPSELGNLKSLEELNLAVNKLTGAIPSTLGNLTKLEGLDLYSNELSGSIPSALGKLTNLLGLFLDRNRLTGEIPSSLGSLKKLEFLDLSMNELTGEIPESFNNLTRLVRKNSTQDGGGIYFSLSTIYNQLSGKIPALFRNSSGWKDCWYDIMANNKYDLNIVDVPAPPFRVKDIDGNILDSKVIYPDNKYTIIFDWATWCPYSKAIMPVMIQLYNQYKDHGLEIIGLTSGEEEENIRTFISQKGIQWKNFIATETNKFDYSRWSGYPDGGLTPQITIVDSTGRVVFTDCINNRDDLTAFIKGKLGEGEQQEYYTSTDFSADGKTATLQTASSSKDIKVVLMGDGFSDRLIADGTYDAVMQKAKDALFSTEPIRSFKDRFTVYSVTAVSENEVFANSANTAFSGYFGSEETSGDDPEDENAIYSWTGGSDGGKEKGGVAIATDGESVNIPYRGYWTIRVNQKKSAVNTDYVEIQLDQPLKAGDQLSITGFIYRGDRNGTLYMKFGNGHVIDEGTAAVWNNINPDETSLQPNTNTYDLTPAAGSKTFRIVRSQAGTNVYITNITITRKADSSNNSSTHVGGDNAKVFEYAKKVIGAEGMDDAIIIVIMNSYRWAGTCWMYRPEKTNAWGSGATIAYVPNFDGTGGMFDYVSFETLLAHEAVGHGFAKLNDEYVEHEQAIPASELETYKAESQFGWWKNIDFTSNPQEVKWNTFISDSRYANENIGAYEGGATYRSGVWRPTEKSIMSSDDTEFNAPSREAIWYRLNKLTQGENWEGTHEDFVAFDKATATARARARTHTKDAPKPVKLAPPVVKTITWRMER